MVKRSGVVIMLAQLDITGVMRPNSVVDPEGGSWDTYIWIDDADALYAELKARGVKIVRAIGTGTMDAAISTSRIATDTGSASVDPLRPDSLVKRLIETPIGRLSKALRLALETEEIDVRVLETGASSLPFRHDCYPDARRGLGSRARSASITAEGADAVSDAAPRSDAMLAWPCSCYSLSWRSSVCASHDGRWAFTLGGSYADSSPVPLFRPPFILLVIPATQIYGELSRRSDIWWTPLPLATSLARAETAWRSTRAASRSMLSWRQTVEGRGPGWVDCTGCQ